ncbi:hypothetical protein [Orrella sp. 11846]|uniref:hypothetical protein n=1 Tax=Orrella sp. 11846 TaxID=3409913 RepID=UPI003B5AC0B3
MAQVYVDTQGIMLALFSYAAQAIFLLVVVYFALHMALEFRVLLISRRVHQQSGANGQTQSSAQTQSVWSDENFAREASGTLDELDAFPTVTVFLPVRDEAAVVGRLIDAVS